MKVKLEEQQYDTLLIPTEWRDAAAIVGIIRYFDFVEDKEGVKLYEITRKCDADKYSVYNDIGGYIEGILYNQADITEIRYLKFCEELYGWELPHIAIERKISKQDEEYTEDEISDINSYISGVNSNTILKKVFDKTRFDGQNMDKILELIECNRQDIVRETFRYKTSMYRNFANVNKLFSEQNPHCRLLGFDLDENRKSKSNSYRFDTDTFVSKDEREYDFIPFAFTYSREGFFVNNNASINVLVKSNECIRKSFITDNKVVDNSNKQDTDKTKLIKALISADEFLQFDVEVICKNRQEEVFNTFFLRKKSIRQLKQIYDNYNIKYIYKYNYNYWLIVEDELIDCCINGGYLDSLIERLLIISKSENYPVTIISKLIDINVEWKEVDNMDESVKRAKNAGYVIGQQIKNKNGENKVKGYRDKLINAIVSHNRDRVLEIMLQMSGYVGGEIGTIYDILEDNNNWFDVATSFANALVKYEKE